MAHLTSDEERLESVELRGHSTVTASDRAPGALQSLSGRDMDLKYGPDGEAIEHAIITGDAVLQLAGQKGSAGRQITANVLDITLAPDGATPVGLVGRDVGAAHVSCRAGHRRAHDQGDEPRCARRSEEGTDQRALHRRRRAACLSDRRTAAPECDVDYREQDAKGLRRAKASSLTVALKPGMSSIEEATFSQNVRFQEGALGALAAHAKYVLDTGTLELTGTEPVDAPSASRKRADHHRRDAHRRHARRAEDEGDRRGQQRAEAGQGQGRRRPAPRCRRC